MSTTIVDALVHIIHAFMMPVTGLCLLSWRQYFVRCVPRSSRSYFCVRRCDVYTNTTNTTQPARQKKTFYHRQISAESYMITTYYICVCVIVIVIICDSHALLYVYIH